MLEPFFNSLNILSRKDSEIIPNYLAAKIFDVDEKTRDLLLLTDNKINKRQLPFENVFINCEIPIESKNKLFKRKCCGFYLRKDDESSDNLFCFMVWVGDETIIDNQKIVAFNKVYFVLDNNGIEDKDLINEYEKQNFGYLVGNRISHQDFKSFLDKLALFVVNFLDLINSPEVEIIDIRRTDDQNAKRIKRGKQPIPSYSSVKVTGKLKIYIDKMQSEGNFNFSHRFWVRGHFRTFRDENRYGKNTGKKIWILPFIKGSGILINKNYEVKHGF